MPDETLNYSVIKLIVRASPFCEAHTNHPCQVALNEQFMVACLSNNSGPKEPESQNRVLSVLMSRLGSSKTFGENMIFMLNRACK